MRRAAAPHRRSGATPANMLRRSTGRIIRRTFFDGRSLDGSPADPDAATITGYTRGFMGRPTQGATASPALAAAARRANPPGLGRAGAGRLIWRLRSAAARLIGRIVSRTLRPALAPGVGGLSVVPLWMVARV